MKIIDQKRTTWAGGYTLDTLTLENGEYFLRSMDRMDGGSYANWPRLGPYPTEKAAREAGF